MKLNLPKLILASASPRRSELLRFVGLEFDVIPSEAPEPLHEHLSPYESAQLHAYRKARSVAKRFPDDLIIGADTVVSLGTTLFGKPADRAEAEHMLMQLEGRTHEVITGVCLLLLRRHRQSIFPVSTSVKFRELNRDQIRRYLDRINPLDKAGSYAIQNHGELIVSEISGSFSNVVGLPVERVLEELENWRE